MKLIYVYLLFTCFCGVKYRDQMMKFLSRKVDEHHLRAFVVVVV